MKLVNKYCLHCCQIFPVKPHRRETANYCSYACSGKHKSVHSGDAFWSMVDMSNGPSSCWGWLGGKSKGYGQISFPGRKKYYAHRRAWELLNGPISSDGSYHGTCVCHKCDNPGCCNPAHMFLGSAKDNSRDIDIKGRANPPRGERARSAKTHASDVVRMREMRASGSSVAALCTMFGLKDKSIYAILSRKNWKHI